MNAINDHFKEVIETLKQEVEEARATPDSDYAKLAERIHDEEGKALEANQFEAFNELHELIRVVFADWSKQKRQSKGNGGDDLPGLQRLLDEVNKDN